MAKKDMTDFVGENDEEAGIKFSEFINALQIWSFMQDELTTVRQCADAFGVTDDVIRKAANEHFWMFLSGPEDDPTKQIVEHEGE